MLAAGAVNILTPVGFFSSKKTIQFNESELEHPKSYEVSKEWHWESFPVNITGWHLPQTTSPTPPEINVTCVSYCANCPLFQECQHPGLLGLWYVILTNQSLTVNLALMLMIWLAGPIRFWCIDFRSGHFLTGLVDRWCVLWCRSRQPLRSRESWSSKGQRDVFDCIKNRQMFRGKLCQSFWLVILNLALKGKTLLHK